MIQLTREPIDTSALIAGASRPEAGAVVLFLGTTREMTDGRQTLTLDYEAYDEMAEKQLAELEAEARRRWPLVECLIVHRLGRVPLAEASVAIVVSTPHRADAFAAGEWLIDSLKRDVPIWKQEHWADGTSEWVHPDKDRETGRHGDEVTSSLLVSPSPCLLGWPESVDRQEIEHVENLQYCTASRSARAHPPQPADQRHRSL